MDPVTIGMGVFGLGFGAYTSVLRLTNPAKLGKLEAMRERFGPTAGAVIHVAAYSIAPLVVGAVMLVAGLRGVSVL